MTPASPLDEIRDVAARFGVALEQARRDHLISVLLAALSRSHADEVIFFGGTALSRSHLTEGRLSEDIDLIAVVPRPPLAEAIMETFAAATRRAYGRVTWNPSLASVQDTESGVLSTDDGLAVRVQLLTPGSYPPWPTERKQLAQRYSDVDPATLEVPTIAAFAAWKTVAWYDRRASRDLFDLWALANEGALSPDAALLYEQYGPTGKPPASRMFADLPADSWEVALGAQTKLNIGPREALAAVGEAWSSAVTRIPDKNDS